MRQQGDITLQDACNLYTLDNKARGLSASTIASYEKKMAFFVAWCIDERITMLHEITPIHLRKFLVAIQERDLSNRYQVNLAKTVKTFFNYCVRDELLAETPFAKVRIPKQKKKILPSFTAEQVKALVKACRNPRDLAICHVLLDSGLRASELLGLNVGDVDMRTGTVAVKDGKGGKDRVTYIGSKTQKVVYQYLLERGKPIGEAPLFVSLTSGNRLTLFGLAQLMERLRLATGVACCTAHTFRRTFAIACLRNGMNIYVLARLMGHVDIIVLKQYLDLIDDDTHASHKRHGPADNWRR